MNLLIRLGKHRLAVSIGIALIALSVFSGAVFAVNNNSRNVPQTFIDALATLGQFQSNNNTCNGFNNSGYKWISYDDDSKIATSLNGTTVDIPETQGSVGLRLNVIGAYCNSIINKSTGKITDINLQESQITLSGAPTIDSNGIGSISVGNFRSGDYIRQSYDTAIYFNDRYAKQQFVNGTNNSDIPEHHNFTLQGLASLAPSYTPYNVTLVIPVRNANHFRYGYKTKPAGVNSKYACVADQTITTDLSGPGCPPETVTISFKIRRLPAYDGSCKINRINGIVNTGPIIEIPAGQRFDANFTVTNKGQVDWSTYFMKLGSWQPQDTQRWGPQRVTIKEEAILGGTFPVVRAGKSSTWSTSGQYFTAPTIEGNYQFSWRILQEGGTAQGFKNIVNIGSCSAPVHVKVLKNRPFVAIQGADVLSGAGFRDTENSACFETSKAKTASIRTNGYHDSTLPGARDGSSMTQYGVFASGNIGSYNSGWNTFRGNYGYSRTTNNAIDDIFDGLFATSNNVGNPTPGQFYGLSDPLPCETRDSSPTTSLLDSAQVAQFIQNGEGSAKYVGAGPLILGPTSNITGNKTINYGGDVIIQGNLRYATSYLSDSIPYLKIIANNIYIKVNSTTVIDGNLVAFPVKSGNTLQQGVLDTCSDMVSAGQGVWPNNMVIGSCRRVTPSLVINGSVTARRILWKRTYGTLGKATDAANAECVAGPVSSPLTQSSVTQYANCAAELIKFSPEAYLSGFNQAQGTFGVVPQSSQELPPIY